ncbi:transforming protein [human papillomavirus 83]|uniref:Protein E7 n=1 Tax=human papillomavirus 83 TaxID=333772 RepID=Q9WNM9_9PAPI|nr:transforming protein [human papillomavirus 83]AEA76643.1 E7 [human papillomavirus 83]WAB53715.1 E7 [human papillomavirus 83]WAB54256.1 E7 [human papillomavirus 83]
MHGHTATIAEIVLEEIPDIVDLYCNEQGIDSSEEEDDRDCGVRDQLAEQAKQAYRVLTVCGMCGQALRLAVLCEDADLKRLQDLLVNAVDIVCPGCA